MSKGIQVILHRFFSIEKQTRKPLNKNFPKRKTNINTMKKNKTIQLVLIFLLSSCCFQTVYAQLNCTVGCFANVEYFPSQTEEVIIHPLDLVAFANGDCLPDFEYFIGTDMTANPGPPPFPLMDSLIFPAGTSGIFPISVTITDGQGNPISDCWGVITITQGSNACNPDNSPPTLSCNDLVFVSNAIGEDFVIYPDMLVEGIASDSCSLPNDIEYFITLDGTLTSPPTTDSIIIPLETEGIIPVFVWAVDEAGNGSSCESQVDLYSVHHVTGTVYIDDNQDCLFNNNENGIGNTGLRYSNDEGLSFTNFSTDIFGAYDVFFVSKIRDPFLEIILPNGMVTSCPTSINLAADPGIENHDFAFQLFDGCDQMVVDVSTIGLRICDTAIYHIKYCNYSTTAIDDVEVTITLPADMNMVSGSLPFTDLGNNQFLFNIGTVASAMCGGFNISAGLDCNVPLGATRCVEASIVPNSCNDVNWNGSTLRVTGECDDTENLTRFKIENIGVGGMATELNYMVVEDVVMSMTNPIQLAAGGIETIDLPANGSTWRIEIPQEDGHPSLSIPSASIEGCGGYGSMGYITQFSTPDVDPYIAIDCQEVVGSWDPNDKQAAPTGYATENFIEQNISIEYKIRFQNTGTAPAFNVRLEDRISEHLDISSIETGASSHPYRVELKEDGLLIFHFENIMLPDSATNLEESQGFVQFRIHQLLDNDLGTVIENTADIYFDYNEAVVTNTVHHTIGTNFIPTGTVQTFVPNLKIGVAPNPFSNFTNITLEGIGNMEGEFELYDVMGRLVKTDSFSDNIYRLERNELSSGTYFFRFLNGKGVLANGKLVVQ